MARTALLAGTASATVNAVNRHAAEREEERAAGQYYQQQAQQPQTAAAPGSSVDDIGDQLATLAKLHDGGSLSDEEFAAAKNRLLA